MSFFRRRTSAITPIAASAANAPRRRTTPVPPTSLEEIQLFNALKAQIIALATAAYGSAIRSTTPYDVLPFHNSAGQSDETRRPTDTTNYGVALIYYNGPANTPHTSWEMLLCVNAQESVTAGAQELLRTMQSRAARMISDLLNLGDWKVMHPTVPDTRKRALE